MEEKTVLVTAIGGNVGQGILRNIGALEYDIRLVGTNTLAASAGNHLVSSFYQVPLGVDKRYIPTLQSIIDKEQVDLVIPSTDFEVEILSQNLAELNTKVACADSSVTKIYLDKFLSFEFHKLHEIPFAISCLPSQFNEGFIPAIAKPRLGRGSRGLIKNYIGEEDLSDSEYLVQKMYSGKEITTAAYVSYTTGLLVGFITMERTLENGATTFCKVIKDHDQDIGLIIDRIVSASSIRGAFNIQCILTEKNEVFPFEVNCRISGTNSIRSHFGFEDVRYTIEELLFNKAIIAPVIKEGMAYRYLADVIYTEGLHNGDSSDNYKIF